MPVPTTLPTNGYDRSQRAHAQKVDTNDEVEAIRKAMKGMGCDEKALIKALTSPKYRNPWAMEQLVEDYNKRFMRDLAKDIEGETRGDFETALLALIRGPLENDARLLEKALNRAGTDEDALMYVLLNRSNADLIAIIAEYKRIHGRELLAEIKDDVNDDMYRLYSMILSAKRAEDGAPVVPHEIDQKVTELQRATEGTIGTNVISVVQVFSSCNNAQTKALSEAYQHKYHRSLRDVIQKEFHGDMEDILLTMLTSATDRARMDASQLRTPLYKTVRKDRLFIHRVLTLYRDPERLDAAKDSYKKQFGVSLAKDVKDCLSSDYEKLMLALLGEK